MDSGETPATNRPPRRLIDFFTTRESEIVMSLNFASVIPSAAMLLDKPHELTIEELDALIQCGDEYAIRAVVVPEVADYALKYNVTNRGVSAENRKKLTHAIAAYEFQFTGHPIIFTNDGKLGDGQHRLYGCLEAGVSFETLMLFGMDRSIFDVLDTGKKRSAADRLTVEGLPNGNQLASALGWRYQYDCKNPNARFHMAEGRWATHHKILELHQMYPNLGVSINIAGRTRGLISPNAAVALHSVAAELDPVNADLFTRVMINGIDPENPTGCIFEKNAALLHRRLSKEIGKKTAKLPAIHRAAYWVKAWNASRDGKTCAHFRFNDSREEFPRIR